MPDKYVTNFNMADGTNVKVKDAQLTAEVNTVKGRVTTAEGNISTLQGSVTTLQGNVTALQNADTMLSNRITGNTNTINSMNSIAKPLSERKFIFIGDSYDAGWTPEGTFTGWGERAASVLKKTLGVDYWNQYYGGAGFGFATDNQMSFYYQIKSVGDSMSSATKNSITDIVFGGGRNDVGKANNTVNQGIHDCADYISANFPNARVWIFAIGWDRIVTVKRQLMQVYYECYSRAVDYGNWVYREIFQYLQQKYYMGSDGKHPNSDGNYLIGNQIGNILCGSEKTDCTLRVPINLNSGIAETNNDTAMRLGNYVVLRFLKKTFLINNGISHDNYTNTGIAVDSAYIMGSPYTSAQPFKLNVVLTVTSGNTVKFYETSLSCMFQYDENDANHEVYIYARHNCMNDDHTNYIVDANITNIEIEDQTVILPILY